jgi:hypothetical protein
VNAIGGFLCELAVVERVQPEPLCWRIDVLARRARLHVVGGDCEVDLRADRRVIIEALAQVVEAEEPSLLKIPVVALPGRHDRWADLLYDLGWYAPDMDSISRVLAPDRGPLRYDRIERSGNQALVTVTDGHQPVTRTIDLDVPALPVAIPVEIADSIVHPAHRPTHWGPPPPRTGPPRTWLHRMLRRP